MLTQDHLDRLRRQFAEAPSSLYEEEDLHVSFGHARIEFEFEEEDLDASGFVDPSLYTKLLHDASALAAGSLVEDHFVASERLAIRVQRPMRRGEVTAFARVKEAEDDRYEVEAILLDKLGQPVVRARGVFVRGDVPRPSDPDAEPGGIGIWDSPYGPLYLN